MTMSNNSFAWYLWHSREEQFSFYFPQFIWIVWRSQDGCCPCSLILQSKLSESCCRLLTRSRSSDSPPPPTCSLVLFVTYFSIFFASKKLLIWGILLFTFFYMEEVLDKKILFYWSYGFHLKVSNNRGQNQILIVDGFAFPYKLD